MDRSPKGPSPTSGIPPPLSAGKLLSTRAQLGVYRANPCYPEFAHVIYGSPFFVALNNTVEPKGFKSASKSPKWVAAMDDEMHALCHNNTWDLVPCPPGVNVVGANWVYWTKFISDGSVDRLKARLVAQDFSQVPGFDFHATFSPIIKASTVPVVLSLAIMQN